MLHHSQFQLECLLRFLILNASKMTFGLYDILRWRRFGRYFTRYGPWIGIVFGFCLIVSGCTLTVFVGIPSLQVAVKSNSWPTTAGKMSHSRATKRLERHVLTDRMDWVHRVEVKYEYEVDGQKYEGTNITAKTAQMFYPTQGAAEMAARNYPVGSTVTVFYHPDRPHESVLENGGSMASYLPLIFGILLMVGGILMIPAALLWYYFVSRSPSGPLNRGP